MKPCKPIKTATHNASEIKPIPRYRSTWKRKVKKDGWRVIEEYAIGTDKQDLVNLIKIEPTVLKGK